MRSVAQLGVPMGRFTLRLLLFALLWWALTENDLASWSIGVPAVIVATWVSSAVSPATSWRWCLSGLIWFVPFFLWYSWTGSVDVSRRAFQRSLPLNPTLLVYPWRLPPGPARVFFANTANLLPGTLSTELQDTCLVLHVMDGDQPLMDELQALETRIAALFGLQGLPEDSREAMHHA